MKHRNTLSSHVSCFFHTKMFDFIYGASFRPRNLVGNVWQERRAVLEGIWGERVHIEMIAVKDCPPLLPDVTDEISWPKRSTFYEII